MITRFGRLSARQRNLRFLSTEARKVDDVYIDFVLDLYKRDFTKSGKTKALIKENWETFGNHELDTGSPEAQIAVITAKINSLNDHCRSQKKDKAAKRRLHMLIDRRLKTIRYLRVRRPESVKKLTTELGIDISEEEFLD